VERLLRGTRAGGHEVLACSITLTEISYTAVRAKGEDATARMLALVNAWPLEWVDPGENALLQAGRLKASRCLPPPMRWWRPWRECRPQRWSTRIPSWTP